MTEQSADRPIPETSRYLSTRRGYRSRDATIGDVGFFYYQASAALIQRSMVDLSHTSHMAQRQVLRIAKAPVIFSHSSWYVFTPVALCKMC